jgi:hypothetical protein
LLPLSYTSCTVWQSQRLRFTDLLGWEEDSHSHDVKWERI